ncbi:MAG TPA: ATP-binding cassette domain-containing protein, partial [Candidatus Obscuribacter sp.]|nr:ATP-binding cassette domain-containing protein [Candidatus Obscuribacter sp.]
MTVLLEAVNVVKRYDGAGTNAVNGISLQVEEGEFYSFLGPSGCGKTTLLRIFAGFETLTTGSVLIGGKVMNDLPAYRRPVNMVFQSYALFPHLSVFENVAFGLRHGAGRKITGLDIAAEVDKALDTVRLKALKNRMPSQLSGGQQQRVALARALAVRPLVLLLDEPLSALDVQIREEMQEELSRLKRELNMTFVMVTHDQSEALALSSRVAVFNAGNLEQVGS